MTLDNVVPSVKTLSTFRRDHHQRRKLFVEDSFQHSAKSNLYQLAWILNHFTDAGDIVLDPMGGIGSTFIGATMKRSVIIGEIEGYWMDLLNRNRNRISSSWLFTNPMLSYQGDAMNLPIGSGAISAVVTSPPYWDTFSDWNICSKILGRNPGPYGSALGDDRGQETKRNLGNIHIYEDYLRAMAMVYSEIHRVLKNDGVMALIIKDRIHKRSRVPIVQDTIALSVATGFSLIGHFEIPTRPSQYRTLHRQRYPNNPDIACEAIVVMQKCPPGAAIRRKIAIVEGIGPKMENGPGPAQDFFSNPVFNKTLAYAQSQADEIYVLVAKQGLISLEQDVIAFDPELGQTKAKDRRTWVFQVLCDQVMKGGFSDGDQITLCVSRRYARYLRQRLETLGCNVEEPLNGLNLGQQLAWLTERGF